VLCNAVALFWVTQRIGPHFSPNIKLGATGFLGAAYDPSADYNGKTPSIALERPAESFPSFVHSREASVEEMNLQDESIRKTDAPANRGTSQPSYVRFHSQSRSISSKPSWPMESVAGLFCKNPEQQQEEHQLAVSVMI
jgi:hypothetical protein